jgi:2,3-bisphosphoglycerate-independent phosphoglycerate mutase
MLGHTGNLKAAVKGMEVLDGELGKLIKEVRSLCGEAVILADHGNCDDMGVNVTNHSKHPVPFIVISDRKIKLKKGGLANVAPTILQLMRLKVPKEMTSKTLIK